MQHLGSESELDRILRDIARTLPPEQRLEGLSPGQRLEGLSPDQRLEGLSPEEVLKGLTPEKREQLRTLLLRPSPKES